MTVEWFDLGQRLRAADTGHVVDRLRHAPVAVVPRPVAVRARMTGEQVTVTAATDQHPTATATGPAALDLLGTLGVTLTAATPATLVTDTPATLALLHRLARTAAHDTDHDSVGAHIAWWRDRADFPGGRAVVDTLAACRLRWVTGTGPTAETHPGTWRHWLNLPDDAASGLLAIHQRLTDRPAMQWLDALAEDDVWAYTAAQSEHSDGLDWRRPDSTSRAALGLRGRCDAADLYTAALLSRPAVPAARRPHRPRRHRDRPPPRGQAAPCRGDLPATGRPAAPRQRRDRMGRHPGPRGGPLLGHRQHRHRARGQPAADPLRGQRRPRPR